MSPDLALLGLRLTNAQAIADAKAALPPGLVHATRNQATTRIDVKVLVRLYESLNDEDFKPVRSWFVANLLSVNVASVNRALRHLQSLGYIQRGARCGNGNYGYRLAMPEVAEATA